MHTIIMTWPRPLWPCQSGGSVTFIAGNSVAEDEIMLQWPFYNSHTPGVANQCCCIGSGTMMRQY